MFVHNWLQGKGGGQRIFTIFRSDLVIKAASWCHEHLLSDHGIEPASSPNGGEFPEAIEVSGSFMGGSERTGIGCNSRAGEKYVT